MRSIDKIIKIAFGSPFNLYSVAPYLLALQLAIYLCFLSATLTWAENKQRVLILHAYHIGYPWSDSVTEGLKSALEREKNVDIFFEYMDTKRHLDKPYLEKLLQLYKYKYGDLSLDVIICSDDNALYFLLINRDDLFPNVPIVFCGINNLIDSRIAGHTNITGVVEHPDILGTLQIALRLHPETRQVVVVHDQTKSGLANAARMKKIAPDFENQIGIRYFTNTRISELKDALRALSAETIVLHLSFARDRNGVFLPLEEASRLVNDNTACPVYTCWDVRMKYPGHCGGKVVSGQAQGETAARMALGILHGKSANEIDIIRKSPNVDTFDYAQLNRFGLTKKDLPKDSIIINEPFSFYENYKERIWITSGVFVFLILLVLFLVVNIFRRKRAEEKLREAYSIINRSPAVVFLWKNAEGWPVEFVSDNVKELFGYTVEEFTSGKVSYATTVHPDDLERVAQKITTCSREKGKGNFFHKPYRIFTKDGGIKWLDDMAFIRRNRKGHITHYQGIVLDISERVKAEDEKESLQAKLQISKKMESIGLLAGGVAHDLNNVLSGIVSYPELLLLDLPEDSKLRKPIETIQDSGHRAAAIVQDLLTVARGVATTKKPLDINDIVSDYLQSPEFKKLKHFSPAVTVKADLDSDLINISGSHVHIRKVVMNLVSNASEAIEGSGSVTVSTMNRYLDRPLRGYEDVNIGEYAVLSVSDDGLGISSDDLERIFEPFYTKKVMGRSGTGLGLAVVWNVVRNHKGYIDLTTGENGTIFELYFPITRDEIPDKNASIPIDDYKGNGETILVVDDVESQRDISCKMMETLGYKTKSVSSGEAAIEYLKEHTADLVLLDMIMDPGINGRETYERIIKIHPGQKAFIVSGFAETDEVKRAQKLGAGQYIRKPLTLARIGIAIKEELED